MWISAKFGVEVAEWVYRFISGDLTLVHELVERHEAVHPGTQARATVTTAGPEIDVARLSELHRSTRAQRAQWDSRTGGSWNRRNTLVLEKPKKFLPTALLLFHQESLYDVVIFN